MEYLKLWISHVVVRCDLHVIYIGKYTLCLEGRITVSCIYIYIYMHLAEIPP